MAGPCILLVRAGAGHRPALTLTADVFELLHASQEYLVFQESEPERRGESELEGEIDAGTLTLTL